MATDTELTRLVKDRIIQFMTIRQYSIKDLSERSGITDIGIRNWFPKKNYIPTLPALEKVAAAFDIYPYELLCRDEDVMPVSPENKELLKKVAFLSERQRHIIVELIDSMITPGNTK